MGPWQSIFAAVSLMKKLNFNIFKPQQQRFTLALAASVAVHILLAVFIVVEKHDKPLPKKATPQIMDVVLLDEEKSPSKKSNKDARTISNINATGSSRDAKDRMTRKAKAPMPNREKPKPPTQPKQAVAKPKPRATPKKVEEKDNSTSLIAKQSKQPVHKNPIKTKKVEKKQTVVEKPRQLVPLANLMPSAMALSQLSQDFERERRMKQKLTREADIPINTRQAKYAPYAQTLVRALEDQWRPGDARYEEYSEYERSASIKITIEHDGSLGGIEILRPSLLPQVNESAIKAIHAAAPFKLLPSSWGLDRANFYLTFEVVENGFVFRQM